MKIHNYNIKSKKKKYLGIMAWTNTYRQKENRKINFKTRAKTSQVQMWKASSSPSVEKI